MNQSNAADATRRMAEAHQQLADGDKLRIYKRVEDAVFSHAFEFIPDSAVHAVVDHDGQPLLLALDGSHLYVLSVDDLSIRTVGAATTLDLIAIDPLRSKVRSTVEYVGVRTSADPMERRTTWGFDINEQFGVGMSTHVIPESAQVKGDEEFAQALANTLGWRSPEKSRRMVKVKAA